MTDTPETIYILRDGKTWGRWEAKKNERFLEEYRKEGVCKWEWHDLAETTVTDCGRQGVIKDGDFCSCGNRIEVCDD